MSRLTIELPAGLKKSIEALASREGYTVSQFVASAAGENWRWFGQSNASDVKLPALAERISKPIYWQSLAPCRWRPTKYRETPTGSESAKGCFTHHTRSSLALEALGFGGPYGLCPVGGAPQVPTGGGSVGSPAFSVGQ